MVDRNCTDKGSRGARPREVHGYREAPDDGVIVLSFDRPAAGITPRGFMLLVAAFLVFKGAVIAHVGAVPHADAIRALRAGGALDQAAAFIMAPDPVSLAVSGSFGSALR